MSSIKRPSQSNLAYSTEWLYATFYVNNGSYTSQGEGSVMQTYSQRDTIAK